MASLNKCLIIGNCTKEPEKRFTASGVAVTSFSVATNEKYKDKGGEWQEKAEFHNVTTWGKLAEIVGEYGGKGRQVYVEGKLQTRKFQDRDGKDRYVTEIVAEKVLFLGGKRDSGGGESGTYEEPPFNPDDDSSIPF